MAFDRQIAAATIYAEASGAGPEGIKAVAWVIANRVRSGRWGANAFSVCLWRKQFSCWNDDVTNRADLLRVGKIPISDKLLQSCLDAFDEATTGGKDSDPTGGATFYHNAVMAPPFWASGFVKVGQIGPFIFYREPK